MNRFYYNRHLGSSEMNTSWNNYIFTEQKKKKSTTNLSHRSETGEGRRAPLWIQEGLGLLSALLVWGAGEEVKLDPGDSWTPVLQPCHNYALRNPPWSWQDWGQSTVIKLLGVVVVPPSLLFKFTGCVPNTRQHQALYVHGITGLAHNKPLFYLYVWDAAITITEKFLNFWYFCPLLFPQSLILNSSDIIIAATTHWALTVY